MINGCFYVVLGFLSVADLDVSVLYLGVMVGTDDEMDKVVIVLVFYALWAVEVGNVLIVGGQVVVDFVLVVHSYGLVDLEYFGCTVG